MKSNLQYVKDREAELFTEQFMPGKDVTKENVDALMIQSVKDPDNFKRYRIGVFKRMLESQQRASEAKNDYDKAKVEERFYKRHFKKIEEINKKVV
jgi:hypothetical protein